jgi:hypothetical protein
VEKTGLVKEMMARGMICQVTMNLIMFANSLQILNCNDSTGYSNITTITIIVGNGKHLQIIH